MECCAKHTHYLLGVGDKVRELGKWIPIFLKENKDVASEKLGFQIFWTLKTNNSICSCKGTSLQSTSKENFESEGLCLFQKLN